jgi:FAD/FMN-containing dehydrogenase
MTLLDMLQAELGADIVRAPDASDLGRHLKDFAAIGSGEILAVAFPRSTVEVSAILRLCNAASVTVVPQGGLTGMVGGALPIGPSVVLSLERMRDIEEVDLAAATMTVQAGVVLERVQNAAADADLFFPLDLGARGSSHIGGNAATNAGGNRVLRYGMMRDLVLGVEAVLADGTVISALNKMIKNNAGYDLKQLFLGTEGTLGIITRLVLRLFPKAPSVCTALCSLRDYDQVVKLLNRAKSRLGSTLSAFETMWPDFYKLGTIGLGRRAPLPLGSGIYVLFETMGTDEEADSARFQTVIAAALADGIVEDAVIAQSLKETREFWTIRDSTGEFPRVFWPQIAFDVSVPTGEMQTFINACQKRLLAHWPDVQVLYFGHVADGNLHLSVRTNDVPMPEHDIDEVVYGVVEEFKGSVSAEHGIGLVKRPFLHHSRSPEELVLMRALKAALDPKNILNPGKVI